MQQPSSNSFPGDDRCETLRKIQTAISKLTNASPSDKNTAIVGINVALKLLKCDD
jgi:hypothetical protein